MFEPTEIEKNNCIQIVKEILKSDDNSKCEKYVADILRTVYSIGGDYGWETLRAVAEIIMKEN